MFFATDFYGYLRIFTDYLFNLLEVFFGVFFGVFAVAGLFFRCIILSVLFLLRFIWTFNKFDDIFVLTGGNAGTRTLTVNVYEQAFAMSNIGAGAAVAVLIFCCLLIFSIFFLKFFSREEGL